LKALSQLHFQDNFCIKLFLATQLVPIQMLKLLNLLCLNLLLDVDVNINIKDNNIFPKT
jgi:hypothetical protein